MLFWSYRCFSVRFLFAACRVNYSGVRDHSHVFVGPLVEVCMSWGSRSSTSREKRSGIRDGGFEVPFGHRHSLQRSFVVGSCHATGSLQLDGFVSFLARSSKGFFSALANGIPHISDLVIMELWATFDE